MAVQGPRSFGLISSLLGVFTSGGVLLPLDGEGRIDLARAASLIGPRTKVLAFSWVSNVLGAVPMSVAVMKRRKLIPVSPAA